MRKEDAHIHLIAIITCFLLSFYGFFHLVDTIDSIAEHISDAIASGFIFMMGFTGLLLQYFLYSKRHDK